MKRRGVRTYSVAYTMRFFTGSNGCIISIVVSETPCLFKSRRPFHSDLQTTHLVITHSMIGKVYIEPYDGLLSAEVGAPSHDELQDGRRG
jgi:hypothetical protein